MRRLKFGSQSINPLSIPLRLDKINVQTLGRPSNFKEKVENFMNNDENSVIVPDLKKSKKGLRYRLMSVQDLHKKFLADVEVECHYSTFARLVPQNIIN